MGLLRAHIVITVKSDISSNATHTSSLWKLDENHCFPGPLRANVTNNVALVIWDCHIKENLYSTPLFYGINTMTHTRLPAIHRVSDQPSICLPFFGINSLYHFRLFNASKLSSKTPLKIIGDLHTPSGCWMVAFPLLYSPIGQSCCFHDSVTFSSITNTKL